MISRITKLSNLFNSADVQNPKYIQRPKPKTQINYSDSQLWLYSLNDNKITKINI